MIRQEPFVSLQDKMGFSKCLVYFLVTAVVACQDYQSPDPPLNQNEWVHPVMFEPQNKIRLTRSTYKVTTFVDFEPLLSGFLNVHAYLDAFRADVSNPNYYFIRQGHISMSLETSPLFNEMAFNNFMKSGRCKNSPYHCTIKVKVDKIKIELQYLEKVFNASHQRFLTAIDHVDYHSSQGDLFHETKQD